MTFEQSVIVVVAAIVGIGSLLGALAAWRGLSRIGRGLSDVQRRADERPAALPVQLGEVRQRLTEVSAQVERTLWTLDALDARLERTTADVTAKRAASDRLRVRLISGQLSLARLRELVRLAIRISELRRAIL